MGGFNLDPQQFTRMVEAQLLQLTSLLDVLIRQLQVPGEDDPYVREARQEGRIQGRWITNEELQRLVASALIPGYLAEALTGNSLPDFISQATKTRDELVAALNRSYAEQGLPPVDLDRLGVRLESFE